MGAGKNFCYTFGVLDALEVSGGRIVAHGWVVSLEEHPITELRLAIGDAPEGNGHREFLSSPDVAKVWPQLPAPVIAAFRSRSTSARSSDAGSRAAR